MRTLVLGTVALLLTAGCVHHGKLRPPSSTARASPEDSHALAEGHGVRLVAYGSSWKGTPRDIERHFTLVQVRLENYSGRPLSVRYELFELAGQEQHAALAPLALRGALSTRAMGPMRSHEPPSRHLAPRRGLLASKPQHPIDTVNHPYNVTPPYSSPPCFNCVTADYAQRIPSPDMLRLALREGPLEDSRTREGFLYFEEALLAERQVTLQARLLDARTGEEFGTLTIPFEVY